MSDIVNLDEARKEREGLLAPPPPEALSFVSKRSDDRGGFNYWDVEPTGLYANDCATGTALAVEYLAFIGAHPTNGNATLLTFIVRDMVEQKAWSGVHAGFLACINRVTMAAAVGR